MFFKRKKKEENLPYLDIPSPLPGKIIPLDQVEDEAFSSKAMGEGFAILPDSGKVAAPFAGKIAHIMEKSKHAVLLEHESGVQLLIHVGMNTVALKGEGFKAHVKSGDRVKKGQQLLEFDIDLIRREGYSVITPVVVPAGQEAVKSIEQIDIAQGSLEETVLRIHF
ncbi:PTS glucose transporter subunit IIA [Paenibacillus sp. FSL R5-0527]|uniref:PTS sugar transporter subunit IIA n=1 Tax=Paenibacillus TaxID=44249 RepID=UPI00097ADB5D|nr:PTS glucose transporter subunit IIA [Paenibacillus macerans]OMG48822.1 PTS glucose transporter subunit IIA [Paenibacillus macerans]